MHPLRIAFIVVASMVGSVVTLSAAGIVTTALAAITGATTRVPRLITATPGEGSTLATSSTGDATAVWFVAVALVFIAAELLAIRRRLLRHEHRATAADPRS